LWEVFQAGEKPNPRSHSRTKLGAYQGQEEDQGVCSKRMKGNMIGAKGIEVD
jgi:hypothetical protein